MIRSFEELSVWQKAHQLAKDVFDVADGFPKKYLFDLTAQLRRAALSVPSNIAEGSASPHTKELVQFVVLAKRSVSETRSLLRFAKDQQLLPDGAWGALDDRYEEVNRMLGGLRRSLSDASTRHSPLVTRH